MPNRSNMSRATTRRTLALTLLLGLGASIGCWRSDATANPPAKAPPSATAVPAVPIATPSSTTPTQTPTTTAGTTASMDAGSAVPAPAVVPTTARIIFVVSPAVNATVTWGKIRLGVIAPKQPLVVVRPRDSGPLDVIVRAPGYLPVHTRAHTFGDNRMIVKLTTPELKNTLLGYRAPIDAGPLLPDGGVAPLDPMLTDEPVPPASTSPATSMW